MRKRNGISSLLILTAVISFSQQNDFPKLQGPYFGQKPPGTTPELFAPDVFGTDNRLYANVTFNSDLTEACWTLNTADTNVYNGGIVISRLEEGAWTAPEEVSFLKKDYSHRSPCFGLNGRRLYFQGYLRKNQGWDQMEKFYYVEETAEGWSAPVLLDTVFNKYAVHWQFSLDKENNLFFGGDYRGKEGTGGIYLSKYADGRYLEPVLIFSNNMLDEAVFAPAISPKGDYIIFARIHSRESDNPRIFSIYISFRNSENKWSTPEDLGEILNMDGNQPRISPDGKFISFIGKDGMSYWVSATIIEKFRPKE